MKLGIIGPKRFAAPFFELFYGFWNIQSVFFRADKVVAAAKIPLYSETIRQGCPVNSPGRFIHRDKPVEGLTAAAPGDKVPHQILVRAAAYKRILPIARKLELEEFLVERLWIVQIRETAEFSVKQKAGIEPGRNVGQPGEKGPGKAAGFFLLHVSGPPKQPLSYP